MSSTLKLGTHVYIRGRCGVPDYQLGVVESLDSDDPEFYSVRCITDQRVFRGCAEAFQVVESVPAELPTDFVSQPESFTLKDSGHRRQFTSGAVRDRAASKPRPALLSPFAIMRIGEVAKKGAEKYSERNWELGIPLQDYVESAYRHLLQFMMGEKDEDHCAQACINLMMLMHTEKLIDLGLLPATLNDLPDYADPLLTAEEFRCRIRLIQQRQTPVITATDKDDNDHGC